MLPDVIADGLKGRKLGAQKVLKDGIPVSDVGTSYAVKLHAVACRYVLCIAWSMCG